MQAKSKCRICEKKFLYDFSGHKKHICNDCKTKSVVIINGKKTKRDPEMELNNYIRRLRVRFDDAIYQFIQLYDLEVYAEKRLQAKSLAEKYGWLRQET